jgi:hypothetical protein
MSLNNEQRLLRSMLARPLGNKEVFRKEKDELDALLITKNDQDLYRLLGFLESVSKEYNDSNSYCQLYQAFIEKIIKPDLHNPCHPPKMCDFCTPCDPRKLAEPANLCQFCSHCSPSNPCDPAKLCISCRPCSPRNPCDPAKLCRSCSPPYLPVDFFLTEEKRNSIFKSITKIIHKLSRKAILKSFYTYKRNYQEIKRLETIKYFYIYKINCKKIGGKVFNSFDCESIKTMLIYFYIHTRSPRKTQTPAFGAVDCENNNFVRFANRLAIRAIILYKKFLLDILKKYSYQQNCFLKQLKLFLKKFNTSQKFIRKFGRLGKRVKKFRVEEFWLTIKRINFFYEMLGKTLKTIVEKKLKKLKMQKFRKINNFYKKLEKKVKDIVKILKFKQIFEAFESIKAFSYSKRSPEIIPYVMVDHKSSFEVRWSHYRAIDTIKQLLDDFFFNYKRGIIRTFTEASEFHETKSLITKLRIFFFKYKQVYIIRLKNASQTNRNHNILLKFKKTVTKTIKKNTILVLRTLSSTIKHTRETNMFKKQQINKLYQGYIKKKYLKVYRKHLLKKFLIKIVVNVNKKNLIRRYDLTKAVNAIVNQASLVLKHFCFSKMYKIEKYYKFPYSGKVILHNHMGAETSKAFKTILSTPKTAGNQAESSCMRIFTIIDSHIANQTLSLKDIDEETQKLAEQCENSNKILELLKSEISDLESQILAKKNIEKNKSLSRMSLKKFNDQYQAIDEDYSQLYKEKNENSQKLLKIESDIKVILERTHKKKLETIALESSISRIEYEYQKRCEEKEYLMLRNIGKTRRANLSPVSNVNRSNDFYRISNNQSPNTSRVINRFDASTTVPSKKTKTYENKERIIQNTEQNQIRKQLFKEDIIGLKKFAIVFVIVLIGLLLIY